MTIAESTKRYWIALALAACFASSANARDLTGVWQSNGIGTALGTYYIRVNGSDVFWLGESSDAGKSWMNVFHGTMKDNVIKGKWADLPLSASGGGGTIEIEYDAEKDILFLNKETGSFSARKWIRLER